MGTYEDIQKYIASQPPEIQTHLRASLERAHRIAEGLEDPTPDVPGALEKLVEIGAEAAKGFPPVGPIVGEALTALLIVMHAAERVEGRKRARQGTASGLASWLASRFAGKKKS